MLATDLVTEPAEDHAADGTGEVAHRKGREGQHDCAIVTQTLQFVWDVRAAFATLHRILAPGGVLLATVPGITKISPPEDEEFGEWWHYTARSAKRLAEEAFGVGNVDTCSYGNVLSASGFLYGLAASDLRPEELAAHDRLYEVIVGVRAVKQSDPVPPHP